MGKALNKTMKRIILTVVCALALAMAVPAVAPQGSGFVVTAQAATKVKISKKNLKIVVGESTKLKISGTKKKVKWSSSKKSVVTVDSKGKVKAKKAGNATITAKVGKKKYKCKVVVKKNIYKTKVTDSFGYTGMINGTNRIRYYLVQAEFTASRDLKLTVHFDSNTNVNMNIYGFTPLGFGVVSAGKEKMVIYSTSHETTPFTIPAGGYWEGTFTIPAKYVTFVNLSKASDAYLTAGVVF